MPHLMPDGFYQSSLAGLSSLGVPGVPWHTQILADQLTLFQPGGTDYAHLITTGTPGFSDLPTALEATYLPVFRFLAFQLFCMEYCKHHISSALANCEYPIVYCICLARELLRTDRILKT